VLGASLDAAAGFGFSGHVISVHCRFDFPRSEVRSSSLLRASWFRSFTSLPLGVRQASTSFHCLFLLPDLAHGSVPPPARLRCFGSFPPVLTEFVFSFDLACVVCELLQREISDTLELPVRKARGFIVQIALPR
jgi:hypothetical protein